MLPNKTISLKLKSFHLNTFEESRTLCKKKKEKVANKDSVSKTNHRHVYATHITNFYFYTLELMLKRSAKKI